MDTLLQAVLLVVLAVAGLALGIGLHTRRLLDAAQRRANRRQQQLEAELGKLRGCLDDMRERLAECEQHAQQLVPPQAPASGFNLNRRTQAIRLLKRGEHPEQIARVLSVPRQEIQLLHKVQQILLSAETPRVEGPPVLDPQAIVREPARREPLGGPIRFQPPVVR